jgi:hypothetical protein
MDNVQLKNRIMRRVYAIYVLRKVFSGTAYKIYAGVALLFGIKVFVHVAAVAENMPDLTDLAGLYNFSLYAIMHTEFAVQFIVFGTAALAIWVMRDSIRNILAHEAVHGAMQDA